MSYTSRVTNKYYQRQTLGTGRISKGPTEGQQIVAALEKADPVLSELGAAYISDKKSDAAVKMQQLYSELGSSEKILERVKSGEDPELTSMYAESVIDGYLGQLDANQHLTDLKLKLGEAYNAETDNLDSFFEEFLPKLEGDRSDVYQRQYYATIEQYKASLALEDAKVKTQVAKDRKISELINLGANTETSVDYWNKMNSLVVPIDGKRKLASFGNINEATIKRAQIALESGDSEEIAFMINVLNYDRKNNGVGKLGDASPENQALLAELVAKHEDKLWEEYTDRQKTKDIEVSDIITQWADKKLTDTQMINAITQIDITKVKYAHDLVTNQTKDANAVIQFQSDINDGLYVEEKDLQDAIAREGNFGDYTELMAFYRTWKQGYTEGSAPIHMKDPYFKSMVTEIPKMVFTGDSGAFQYGSPTQNKLRAEATVFVKNEINDFYRTTLKETGKAPTLLEKQAFETGLRNYVKQNFVDGIQVEALDYENRYDRAIREAAEKKKAEDAKLLKDKKDKEIAVLREELKVEEIFKIYKPDLQLDKLRAGIGPLSNKNKYITVQKDKAGNETGFTFNEGEEINEHLIAVAANSPLVEFMEKNLLTKEEIEMLADEFGISVNKMIGVIGAVKNGKKGAYLLQERQLTDLERDTLKTLGIGVD